MSINVKKQSRAEQRRDEMNKKYDMLKDFIRNLDEVMGKDGAVYFDTEGNIINVNRDNIQEELIDKDVTLFELRKDFYEIESSLPDLVSEATEDALCEMEHALISFAGKHSLKLESLDTFNEELDMVDTSLHYVDPNPDIDYSYDDDENLKDEIKFIEQRLEAISDYPRCEKIRSRAKQLLEELKNLY